MLEMNCKKRLLFGIIFFTLISIAILVTILPGPVINDLVTETHRTLENRLNSYGGNSNLKKKRPNLDEDQLDKTYLELLGFNNKPTLYSNHTYNHLNNPVIVTATTSYNFPSCLTLLSSVQKYLPNHTLVIYDLGLESYETLKVKEKCLKVMNCWLKHFDFSKFPSHIKDYMYTHAYLPILLQQALIDFGCILWVGMETDEYLADSDLSLYINQANQSGGILGWSMVTQDTTSSYTHPYMFSHFTTTPDKYHFHRMLDPSHLLLINHPSLHHHIMLPWVKCSLSWQCISPIGADIGRTCSQRRPRYLYSGCHRYSTSALNIILGAWAEKEGSEYLRLNKSELFAVFEDDLKSTTAPPSLTTKL